MSHHQVHCHCATAEDVDKIILERLSEVFAAKFEHLKDQVVTLMASKLSSLLEENKNLRNEIEQLREKAYLAT